MGEKKVMIVTGGSRGIGAATARLAARQGFAVVLSYHSNEQAAAETVRQIETEGGKALAVCCDSASQAALTDLFEVTEKHMGLPTALINNAGITGLAGRLDEVDPDTIQQVLAVNVAGVMFASQLAVHRMSTRHGGAGGSIVNVSSGAATLGSPGEFTWYAASKAAVNTFTLGLGRELAREGVRVNAVALGLVDTGLHDHSGLPGRVAAMAPTIPMGRAASPEEVAKVILWLVSDEASYITGETLRVAGGR